MVDCKIKEKLVQYIVLTALLFSYTYEIFLDSVERRKSKTMKKASMISGTIWRRDGRGSFSRDPASNFQRQLLQMGPIVKYYNRFTFVIYLWTLIQHSLLYFLNMNSMKELRYLDCYLVGRVSLDARHASVSKYVAILFSTFQFSWMLIMTCGRPKFDLYCLEFLLRNHFDEDGSESAASKKDDDYNSTNYFNSILFIKTSLNHLRRDNLDHLPDDIALIKPNRTHVAWKWLVDFTLYYLLLLSLACIVVVPTLFILLVPMLFTKRGFELNYAVCINYILSLPSSERAELSYISNVSSEEWVRADANKLSSFLPFEEFREVNSWYELTRWTADFAMNSLFWVIACFAFVFDYYLVLMILIDMLPYAQIVRQRLDKLLARMRFICEYDLTQERTSEPGTLGPAVKPTSTGPRMSLSYCSNLQLEPRCLDCDRTAAEETRSIVNLTRAIDVRTYRAPTLEQDIQLTLLLMIDFFTTIGDYNAYISCYTLYGISFWMVFSLTSISYLYGLSQSGLVAPIEIVIIQSFATTYYLIFTGLASQTHKLAFKFYPIITSIIAMDQMREKLHDSDSNRPITLGWKHQRSSRSASVEGSNRATSKLVWTLIMGYFQPVPMYCFSLFKRNEMSWFFTFKVSVAASN